MSKIGTSRYRARHYITELGSVIHTWHCMAH